MYKMSVHVVRARNAQYISKLRTQEKEEATKPVDQEILENYTAIYRGQRRKNYSKLLIHCCASRLSK